MAEVELAARHQQRRTVGAHLAQPDRDQRQRPVGRDDEPDLGEAEDLERLGERLRA